MATKISVVINTLNEEKNIRRVINSVSWADEIVVCDMYSNDKTVALAEELGAKIIRYKKTNYVEPARNYAISKTAHDWILILDADEEVSKDLSRSLRQMLAKPIPSDFVEIPRKNIIFGKWIKASGWWPDYQIRFFKKKSVIWNDKIHSKPQTYGTGLALAEDENLAIIHHNYQSISQFLMRMNRYTDIESSHLISQGYEFAWTDLIKKPLNEFLSRFFANKGYQDGIHGLALSFLQAFSFLTLYLKIWEQTKFEEQSIQLEQLSKLSKESGKDINYWFLQFQSHKNPIKRLLKKLQI